MSRRSLRNTWQSSASRRICALAKSDTVEQAVESLAASLISEGTSLPIDPEILFSRYRVDTAEPDNTLPYPGELVRVPGGFRIRYSAGMPRTRRRFTIAHELCHAIFALTGRGWPRSGEELEAICEMFAAALLMPTWAISSVWDAQQPSVDGFKRAADSLGVSLTALSRRLAELELAVVIKEQHQMWSPLATPVLVPGITERMEFVQDEDQRLLFPGIFKQGPWVRCVVGPRWGSLRYALLLPIAKQEDAVHLSREELMRGFATVREALDRGLQQRERADINASA